LKKLLVEICKIHVIGTLNSNDLLTSKKIVSTFSPIF
jgi:hypothetical protein